MLGDDMAIYFVRWLAKMKKGNIKMYAAYTIRYSTNRYSKSVVTDIVSQMIQFLVLELIYDTA